MKTALWSIPLGLILCSGVAVCEAVETLGPKCQKLADEFAENPDAMNETQLKQLQFCITQTLEQRYKTDPPELLKGTIIEKPLTSEGEPVTTPENPSLNPGAK
jgi:hypothetical protein